MHHLSSLSTDMKTDSVLRHQDDGVEVKEILIYCISQRVT